MVAIIDRSHQHGGSQVLSGSPAKPSGRDLGRHLHHSRAVRVLCSSARPSAHLSRSAP